MAQYFSCFHHVPLLGRLEQCSRVACDHQLLIRRNHPRRYPTAGAADARTAFRIGGRIELHAEPYSVAADSLADGAGMLSDTAGKHDDIHSAERSGERAHFATDAIDIQIDRK